MHGIDVLVQSFVNSFTPLNLLFNAIGVAIGIFVGALPGVSASMAIALLLPLTFRMDPTAGMIMLMGLYIGAMYGGSISAILLRIPGTPAAAATVLDGYELAKQGQAGKALAISLYSGTVAGFFSAIVLLTLAPLISFVAVSFGPPEYFALAVFGLTLMVTLSEMNLVKGLLAGVLGLLVALVGMDPITGYPRFTFGLLELMDGVPYIPALLGLFAISQVLHMVEAGVRAQGHKVDVSSLGSTKISREEWRLMRRPMAIASVSGTIVGMIPGTGGDVACWVAYNEAKRSAKMPEKFGNGSIEGLAAVEGANNSVTGGAFVPMLTLGIPGSSVTAIMLGALLVLGLKPGPTFMTENAGMAYTLIVAVFVSNAIQLVLGYLSIKASVNILRIPNRILLPVIILFSVIGSYAVDNSVFDVYVMLFFGVVGYLLEKGRFPLAPVVLGLVLGQMADASFFRSLLISGGSWLIFVTRPVSLLLLVIAAWSLISSLLKQRKKSRQNESLTTTA